MKLGMLIAQSFFLLILTMCFLLEGLGSNEHAAYFYLFNFFILFSNCFISMYDISFGELIIICGVGLQTGSLFFCISLRR